MKNKLYLECYAGISGDMTVAALLDLGADEKVLRKALESLPVKGFEIKISRVKKAGLDACDFDVLLESELENHDHDMKYLHGEAAEKARHEVQEHMHSHEEGHHHAHSHEEEHHHAHNHEEEHSHEHHHAHAHRGMTEVMGIIAAADLTAHAKELAEKIFTILGKAEAKAHGTTLEEVHFHEVGAVDSIVDIVATAVCLDNLGITEVILPVLYEGTGTIKCQHGILPIPVPAVANIVADNQLRLHRMDTEGEFITPTGAAIAAAIRTLEELPENFTIEKIGLGAGKRNYERPSLVRAMLIRDEEKKDADTIYKLESNIDDCTGENLGYVMEQLLNAGARDVHYTPVFMKKGRPAYQLNVICKQDEIEELENIIFQETTTIGIRRQKMERTVLKRELKNISTPFGEAQIKLCTIGERQRAYPEYQSVVSICKQTGKPFQEIYQMIAKSCEVF